MRTRNLLVAAALMGIVCVAAPGCSSEQTTRTTTQTTMANPDRAAAQSDSTQPRPVASTTTTTSTSNEPDSVLGAAFHLVGTVILLPFRIIGLIV